MKNKVVIYHGNCYDGLTSAWIAWTKLKHTAEYIAGYFGQPLPIFKEPTHIYVVDFSYPQKVFEQWIQEGHKITILDHHATAIDSLSNYFEDNKFNRNLECVFDTNRSGAGITWDYFYPDRSIPKLVQYVQDRDLWKFEFGNTSRYIYSYMQYRIEFTDPLSKQFEIMDMTNEALESNSPIILEKGQQLAESYYKFCRGFAENISVYTCPDWKKTTKIAIITTNKYFGSDTCSYILNQFDFKAAGYFFLESHNTWNWGMRSKDPADVSKLCERYGGGGHPKAAGFIIKDTNPIPKDWIQI